MLVVVLEGSGNKITLHGTGPTSAGSIFKCNRAPVEFKAMHTLSVMACWEGLILLGALFSIVFWKLATGGISLDQLLEGDLGESDDTSSSDKGTYVSMGRAQSLAVTTFVALYFLLRVVQNPSEFPQLPPSLIDTLIGSQVIYLGGKAQAMLGPRVMSFLQRRIS